MTRCAEFYEKLERDGNFCGMSKREYKEALDYFKHVEKDKGGIPLLTCAAWEREQKEAKKARNQQHDKDNLTSDITKEPIEGKIQYHYYRPTMGMER